MSLKCPPSHNLPSAPQRSEGRVLGSSLISSFRLQMENEQDYMTFPVFTFDVFHFSYNRCEASRRVFTAGRVILFLLSSRVST